MRGETDSNHTFNDFRDVRQTGNGSIKANYTHSMMSSVRIQVILLQKWKY